MCTISTACLDSVEDIQNAIGPVLLWIEFIFTFLFSIECSLRLLSIADPREYIFSFMGMVDASSIIPTYLAVVIPSARPLVHLAVLRALRILRVFRVLKLVRFVDEALILVENMQANRRRVAVFLFTVFTLILVIGCAMYLIEGEHHGFTSIPMSLYWTVVVRRLVDFDTPVTIFT